MANRKIIYKIALLFVMFLSLMSLVACSQIKKGINSMSEDRKVTEIKIGETYTMSWKNSDFIEADRSFDYIKGTSNNYQLIPL